jgi:hypothetical protein
MGKIERYPLPPIGRPAGSISPDDVRAYADDLLREAWEGPSSYHPDGGLKDFDDRIKGLEKAYDHLSILEQRIPASPGRDAIKNAMSGITNAQEILRGALAYSQFEAPFAKEPKIDLPDYGPFIHPDPTPTRPSGSDIRFQGRNGAAGQEDSLARIREGLANLANSAGGGLGSNLAPAKERRVEVPYGDRDVRPTPGGLLGGHFAAARRRKGRR